MEPSFDMSQSGLTRKNFKKIFKILIFYMNFFLKKSM
jgi:hypothetical protein